MLVVVPQNGGLRPAYLEPCQCQGSAILHVSVIAAEQVVVMLLGC